VNKGDISRSSAEVHPLPTDYFLSHAVDSIRGPRAMLCKRHKASGINDAVLRELVVEFERRRGHFMRVTVCVILHTTMTQQLIHIRVRVFPQAWVQIMRACWCMRVCAMNLSA
jgi:hypothetical protein